MIKSLYSKTQINTDIRTKENEVICTIIKFWFLVSPNVEMGHRFEHQDAKDNIFDQRFHKKNHMVSGYFFFLSANKKKSITYTLIRHAATKAPT